jgi:GNAT superfamily N-acetyltransferase
MLGTVGTLQFGDGSPEMRPRPAFAERQRRQPVRRHSAGRGTGSALLAAVIDAARTAGAVRVWLITTNDNLDAIAWYEHKGFAVSEVRPGAVDEARAMLKPSIPPRNASNGLAISDEIELTLAL